VIGPRADHFQGPFSSYRKDVNVNGLSLGTCDYNIPAGGCARYDRRPSFRATHVFESDPYIRAWGALFASGPDVGPSTLRIFLEPSEGFFITAIPEPSTWAMLLVGFAGVGFMTYRREQDGANAA
jgi:hypothetical protein